MTQMTCKHLAQLPEPAPEPPQPANCEDCVALGESVWAHLRMCLTCGHVACCDSSPHRPRGRRPRPVTDDFVTERSAEPGETWRWCYPDQRLV